MKYLAYILAVLLLSACSVSNYDHIEYSADGHKLREYHARVIRNAMDTTVTGADVQLADGTHVVVGKTEQQPNANVVNAATTLGQAVITVGQSVLRFFVGVP